MSEHDYIVVGAGSAGCVAAARLAESGASVLLLEAGGTDRRFWVRTPLGYGRLIGDPAVDWRYRTEPEPQLDGRRIEQPRGRLLGGSGSINAMVWVRGHPRDYDDWAASAPGWGWADVAPSFAAMEDHAGGPQGGRGVGGPTPVRPIGGGAHPICAAYLEAARQLGHPVTADYNAAPCGDGDPMEGAALYQLNTRDGRRASSAATHLRPALARARGLTLRTGAMALRVLFHEGRASGVRHRWRGATHDARARRAVVLCAGAIATPQLLQLSGVGPGALLRRMGVPVTLDAPRVGAGLQDHLGVDMTFRARAPTLNQQLGAWPARLREGLRYLLTRRGALAMNVNHAGGFLRLDPGADRPDQQVYFSPLSYPAAPGAARRHLYPDPFPGFRLGANPCRPTSRGTVAIRSPDPSDAPAIHGNYLDTEHDRAATLAGMKLVRALAAAPALAAVIERESLPGPDVAPDGDDAALMRYARATASTIYHLCGTCAMGADGVLDARLRVRGLDGLRVADASVFPRIVTGNTHAPCVMVGERAAAMLIEDA